MNKQRNSNDPPTELPGIARRFGALVADWALCLLVSNLYGNPARDGWPPVLALIVVYALFAGLFAQTPGMALLRIACVDVRTGGRIGIPRALLRGILLCLVLPPLVLDNQRRGWHDRAAGSIIVSADRKKTE